MLLETCLCQLLNVLTECQVICIDINLKNCLFGLFLKVN